MADRVALVAFCWFVLFIGGGIALGSIVDAPRTGAVDGFFLALLALGVWPVVMPDAVENWMNDPLAQ